MAEMPNHPVINLADAKLEESGHGANFLVRRAKLGPLLGLAGIGCSFSVVPPGKRAFPFHRHHVQDELFYIVSGSGEYRFGDARYPVKAGDLVSAPAGTEAHQLVNTGQEDLRYLGISNSLGADIVEYPDSGKLGVGAGIKNANFQTATFLQVGRMTAANYWDGEDGSQ